MLSVYLFYFIYFWSNDCSDKFAFHNLSQWTHECTELLTKLTINVVGRVELWLHYKLHLLIGISKTLVGMYSINSIQISIELKFATN